MSFFESIKLAHETGRPQQINAFFGYITAYNPDTNAIKARYALLGTGTVTGLEVTTGWIQLKSPWAGNAWGMQAGPILDGNDQVLLMRVGNGLVAFGPFYHDLHVAPGAPPGELWMVHKSGQKFKLSNDGRIQLIGSTSGDIDVTSGSGRQIVLSANNASITLDTQGNIEISAAPNKEVIITSNGSTTTLDGSGNLTFAVAAGKQLSITANGASITIDDNGQVTIDSASGQDIILNPGAIVQVNGSLRV